MVISVTIMIISIISFIISRILSILWSILSIILRRHLSSSISSPTPSLTIFVLSYIKIIVSSLRIISIVSVFARISSVFFLQSMIRTSMISVIKVFSIVISRNFIKSIIISSLSLTSSLNIIKSLTSSHITSFITSRILFIIINNIS